MADTDNSKFYTYVDKNDKKINLNDLIEKTYLGESIPTAWLKYNTKFVPKYTVNGKVADFQRLPAVLGKLQRYTQFPDRFKVFLDQMNTIGSGNENSPYLQNKSPIEIIRSGQLPLMQKKLYSVESKQILEKKGGSYRIDSSELHGDEKYFITARYYGEGEGKLAIYKVLDENELYKIMTECWNEDSKEFNEVGSVCKLEKKITLDDIRPAKPNNYAEALEYSTWQENANYPSLANLTRFPSSFTCCLVGGGGGAGGWTWLDPKSDGSYSANCPVLGTGGFGSNLVVATLNFEDIIDKQITIDECEDKCEFTAQGYLITIGKGGKNGAHISRDKVAYTKRLSSGDGEAGEPTTLEICGFENTKPIRKTIKNISDVCKGLGGHGANPADNSYNSNNGYDKGYTLSNITNDDKSGLLDIRDNYDHKFSKTEAGKFETALDKWYSDPSKYSNTKDCNRTFKKPDKCAGDLNWWNENSNTNANGSITAYIGSAEKTIVAWHTYQGGAPGIIETYTDKKDKDKDQSKKTELELYNSIADEKETWKILSGYGTSSDYNVTVGAIPFKLVDDLYTEIRAEIRAKMIYTSARRVELGNELTQLGNELAQIKENYYHTFTDHKPQKGYATSTTENEPANQLMAIACGGHSWGVGSGSTNEQIEEWEKHKPKEATPESNGNNGMPTTGGGGACSLFLSKKGYEKICNVHNSGCDGGFSIWY